MDENMEYQLANAKGRPELERVSQDDLDFKGETMNEYTVLVEYEDGAVQRSQTYEVSADSEDDARYEALKLASDEFAAPVNVLTGLSRGFYRTTVREDSVATVEP